MECFACGFRIIPYFLSQYLIFAVVMLLFSLSKQSTKPYISSARYSSPENSSYWSSSYDPDYFFHLSDIHITHYLPETVENFDRALHLATYFQSQTVLVTGDLVDSYELPFFPLQIQENKQVESDWLNYSRTARKHLKSDGNGKTITRIIESFGNHDIPRIYSNDSSVFYYAKHSMLARERNLTAEYDVIVEKVQNFTFLLLNPIEFPIPPLPFNYFIHPKQTYMDKVKAKIEEIAVNSNGHFLNKNTNNNIFMNNEMNEQIRLFRDEINEKSTNNHVNEKPSIKSPKENGYNKLQKENGYNKLQKENGYNKLSKENGYNKLPNEKFSENINDANIIIATHYQGPVWTSKIAQQLFGIDVLQRSEVKLMLSGHNHGANRMVMHHGDSVEVCSCDLRFNQKCGFVTNDNDNIVFHWISLNTPQKSDAFVTYPVPIDQTTSRTNCIEKIVRILVFNETKVALGEIKLYVDNVQIQMIKVREIKVNVFLFEAMINVENGLHHLLLQQNLDGNNSKEEEEFDFLVGSSQKIEEKKELLYDDMLWASKQWIGLLILFPITLIITFPINCSCFSFDTYWNWTIASDNEFKNSNESTKQHNKTKTKKSKKEKNKKKNKKNKENKLNSLSDDDQTADQLNAEDDEEDNDIENNKFLLKENIINWLISIFFGFFGIRSRLMKLPLAMRIILFIFVLISLIIPSFTFDIEGHFGYMFPFGYFVKGKSSFSIKNSLRYEEWCPFLSFYYFGLAVFPVVLTASSLGMNPDNKESILQIIDNFLWIVGSLIGGIVICFDAFLLLCERKFAALSPFILVPFFWLIAFIAYFVNRRKSRVSKTDASAMLEFLNRDQDEENKDD